MQVRRWIVVAVVCIALVTVLGFIKFMQIRAAIAFGESFPEPSETVDFQVADYSDWQASISVVGEVKASREVVLRTEVEGIIAKIGFVSGGQVTAGELLLQLDISEEQARLDAINPELELARQNLKRISGLSNDGAVSRQQADQIKAQLAIVQAQQVSIEEIIANKTVVAPFTGFVGLHDFEVGEFLPANTVITTLVGGLETLWVDFSLPQRYARLTVGAQIAVRAPDITDTVLNATVQAVEPNISSESRNLKARAVLANADALIKPGAFVQVAAPIGEFQAVIRLLSTAVRLDTFGTYVFVMIKDADNNWRASRRPVTVITKEGDDSIVTAGLQPGEVVATTGSFKLREGMLVHQSNSESQQQATGADTDSVRLPAIEEANDNAD